jgi:hypothetical protein
MIEGRRQLQELDTLNTANNGAVNLWNSCDRRQIQESRMTASQNRGNDERSKNKTTLGSSAENALFVLYISKNESRQ